MGSTVNTHSLLKYYYLFSYNLIMLTDNSTQSFIRRLCDRQREHTSKIYMESLKDKENISKKSNVRTQNTSQKRVRTESSSSILSTSTAPQWIFDISATDNRQIPDLMNQWLTLPEGMFRFHKIYQKGDWQREISEKVKECEANDKWRKCIIIEVNCLDRQTNFTSILTQYCLPILKFGKSSWSVAALSSNRRYDLLSLDCEGTPVWKAKQPLSKVQLQRQQLLRRVFGYAREKQKNLSIQQILAKVTLPSNNIVYFIIKRPDVEQPVSKLLIQQQIIIEGITVFQKKSILSLEKANVNTQSFGQTLKKLGICLRKEEQLSKTDKQSYLKCMISKLQGQLNSQKQELLRYIQSQMIEEEQYPIPSERISTSEKYKQLQRNIKLAENSS